MRIQITSLALVACWLSSARPDHCLAPSGGAATIVIHGLPVDALVFFDGEATHSKGNTRHFATPPIPDNERFEYAVTIMAGNKNDGPQTYQMSIVVGAGQMTSLSFADLVAAKARESKQAPSLGAADGDNVGAFTIRNPFKSGIKYQVRWGEHGEWRHVTVLGNNTNWHSSRLDANGLAATPFIRFWDNQEWVTYRLNFFQVQNPNNGFPYVFGLRNNRIVLYRRAN